MFHGPRNSLITVGCLLFVGAGWAQYIEAFDLLVGETMAGRPWSQDEISATDLLHPSGVHVDYPGWSDG